MSVLKTKLNNQVEIASDKYFTGKDMELLNKKAW